MTQQSKDNQARRMMVFTTLGEVAGLFTSQAIKGTEIVMPSEKLEEIGNRLIDDIATIEALSYERGKREMARGISQFLHQMITGKELRRKDYRSGWSGDESGECCDKCRMDKDAVAKSGRAVALRLTVGCKNPFQLPEVCECHIPFRKVSNEAEIGLIKNILFYIDTRPDLLSLLQDKEREPQNEQ